MPEVVGDAAILVDPADAAALGRAMVALLGDDEFRQKLSAAGPRRAAGFTWEETARRTLAVYDSLLAPGPDGTG
jgi:alpha-1,3-rhamnosyl/mannosyltransferase